MIFHTSPNRASVSPLGAGALRSYTEQGEIEASGTTLAAALADLDRQYAGIRFRMIDEQDRIRRHIRIFVNGAQARELPQRLAPTDEVVIVQVLSGEGAQAQVATNARGRTTV